MIEHYKKSAANTQWTYRWTMGDNPVVMFANSRVSTNVIFSLDELRTVLERTDEENVFVRVPNQIMNNALLEVDGHLAIAA